MSAGAIDRECSAEAVGEVLQVANHDALTRRLGMLAGVSLLLTAGCSNPLGPDDRDYGQRLPESRFRNIERLKVEEYARPAPTIDEKTVRERFERGRFAGLERAALKLEDARASTLENNLDLKVALVEPRIAGQSLRQEEAKYEAVFTPRLRYNEDDTPTLNTTVSNQQDTLSGGAGVSIPLRTGGRASVDLTEGKADSNNPFLTLNTSYSSALTFSFSQPLLRNGGRRASTYSIRVSSYQDQITRARTKLEVIRQLAAADRAYWRLYATRRALEVTQQQYELAVAQLDRVRRRQQAGSVPEVEVIRAESGVAERLGAIISAENSVLLQQRELKRVMNRVDLPIDSPTVIEIKTEPEVVPYQFNAPELAESALATRMEMLELELQLAADASTIEFSRNQALPLVSLDYQYRISGLGRSFDDTNAVLWGNNFESWTLGLSAEIPIGNEAAKAGVQQALLRRLQRLSTKDARSQAIRQEVFNAVDTVSAAWQQIMAARQAVVAAARTFEAEQRQNDVGARTSTDVLDAATRLAEAQLQEIRAISDYQISLVDLSFATGTLLGATKFDWPEGDASEQEERQAQPPGTVQEIGVFPAHSQ